MTMRTAFAFTASALALAGCAVSLQSQAVTPPAAETGEAAQTAQRALEDAAARFLALTLEAGTYEGDYVDAYYGPAELRTAAEANPRPLPALRAEADALVRALDSAVIPALTDPAQLARARSLRALSVAASTRLRMIAGERLPFAEEARGLFATDPVLKPLADYDPILAGLESLLPGEGTLAERVDRFNDRYTIPTDRLRAVFDAAIAECRRRTLAHYTLPEGESFTMEFVTDKPWSGYNYYQGNYRSLIQINTDLPIRISRAVDLGCHEGYPGHHVLGIMTERELVRRRGWQEYSVYPLYSPTSVIAEGTANYGIDLAFPQAERLAFERDVLYPLAGLDPSTADAFWRVQQATEALSGARLTIARLYLDGEIDREQAIAHSQRYLLLSRARAEQSVRFTDRYRAYVLNYGWGKDLVRRYIEAGNPDDATRWQRMERVLSNPTLPADLVAGAR
jgi:hypothetical protein